MRQQLAQLCTALANRWRTPGSMPYQLWQFMEHSAEESQKRTGGAIVGMLRTVSSTRAQKGRPKYKRRRK